MTSGPNPPSQPVPSIESAPSLKSRLWLLALVGVVALAFFGSGILDKPFVDEYAYISQSYYADLLLDGRTNDRAWLDFPAYDLVPLPKYGIGLALKAAGRLRPGPEAARMWYRDTSSQFGAPMDLTVARLPSIALGALGCVALAALGASAFGWRVGGVAAGLLMVNPLYRLHAHRAMSEAPCEAFLMIALAVALVCWRRTLAGEGGARGQGWLLLGWLGAGIAAGLSVLAKFNGLLALMTMAAWVALAWISPNRPWGGKLRLAAGAALAAVAAGACFVALNPYMTAQPDEPMTSEARRISGLNVWERFRLLIDHRREMSRSQQQMFAHNALTTFPERAKVVAVQGFGRFGPLGPASSDSTRRYDPAQDWGAVVWFSLCLVGLALAGGAGYRQHRVGAPPTAWACAAWALVSLAVVTLYLPMAWDRYQLPIQAPFALLAASALVAGGEALARLFRSSQARAGA